MTNKLKDSGLRVFDECYDPEINGISNFSEIWEACKPKLIEKNIPLGEVIIFGTGGEIETIKPIDIFNYPKYL